MSKRVERPSSFLMIWAAIWAVVSTVARDRWDRPRSRGAPDSCGAAAWAAAGGWPGASAAAAGGAGAAVGGVGSVAAVVGRATAPAATVAGVSLVLRRS